MENSGEADASSSGGWDTIVEASPPRERALPNLAHHWCEEVRTTDRSPCLNDKAGHSLIGKRVDDCNESDTDKNTIVHVMGGQDLQEADDEIQMLNDLGLGEDISSDEFLKYFEQLPTKPAVDIYTELDNEQLTALYERHARYRIRYLKVSSCFCIYLFINHQPSCIIYICVASVVYNVICDLFLYSYHKQTPWIS